MRRGPLVLVLCLGLLALAHLGLMQEAVAQARNPFSVGISEGAGQASGLTGYILAQQHRFDLLMREAVRAIRSDGAAIWSLLALAFAYGIFHAAGPGHGKAVLAAYLVANERALKRGLVMAGLAALLQACVAIAIVGGFSLLMGATGQVMRTGAQFIEIGSYGAIALVGVALVWGKGLACRDWLRAFAPQTASRFQCTGVDDPAHVHGPTCGHVHMPDPATLGGLFSWQAAAGTIVAAGLRPCSGAILVLVFSAAQGIFLAGVGATLAMAAGTAITTGALAAAAVYAKDLARRLSARQGRRGALVLRGLEFCAALAVLLLGLALLTGALTGAAG